jgi:hypothetical protein
VSAVVALGLHVPIVWPATVGGVALVWGTALVLGVEGLDVYTSMFDAWEMTSVRVEEAREASGLIIIAAWMGVVVWRARFWGKPRR